MVSYILRRIVATLPVMAIVALFVFSLLHLAPGDPAVVIAGDQASPADVERIRQSLGLDRPFLVQFGSWLWGILHGDLGTSIFTNPPQDPPFLFASAQPHTHTSLLLCLCCFLS